MKKRAWLLPAKQKKTFRIGRVRWGPPERDCVYRVKFCIDPVPERAGGLGVWRVGGLQKTQ